MEKIINMRDLGGIVTQTGEKIKENMLFRAGNPSVASGADCKKLQQLDIEEIIDFRSNEEKRASEQAFAKQFNWIAQPVVVGSMVNLLGSHLTKEMAYQTMCSVYKRFPVEFQAQYHYLLKQAEQGKTMLYHCTAGKDRTGFGTLLLLSALGVDNDTIMEDYLLSNQAVEGLKQQIAGFMQDDSLDPEALNAILEVYPEYLEHSLQIINSEFGGIEKYLKQTLEIDINNIRKHYLLA